MFFFIVIIMFLYVLLFLVQIDDRRIEAEKVLVSHQNTYDTMKKKTELLKGQNKDLQVSMNYKLGR
jgi:hypothetical protein